MFCLTSYRLFSLNICSSAINFRVTASMPDSLTVKQASSGLIGKSGFRAGPAFSLGVPDFAVRRRDSALRRVYSGVTW
jgi:hypothetical protein